MLNTHLVNYHTVQIPVHITHMSYKKWFRNDQHQLQPLVNRILNT